ncbi:nucleotidyltransferase [Reichenbachiella sp.]|uniref:nucleotidyltransferase n=1 Tax=Reichenbachiella sp. TaxID=2184521 RepID=UPI003BB0EA8A
MSIKNHIFPGHFREFIIELNNHHVEYMLIGGFAMGAYGHMRGTNDLDIYINATEENADRIIKASIDYGIPPNDLQKEMFLVPKMIGIGKPPLRIEILKKLDVVDFEYAYQRIKKIELDGIKINIIGLEDLSLLKQAAVRGRNQARDKEDLNFIEKLLSKLKKK